MVVWLVLGCVAAALLLYITASLVLLKFPLLVHKRKQLAFTARNIAHRGGENSRTTFMHESKNHNTLISQINTQAIDRTLVHLITKFVV